jgi:hypothetical protein
MGCEMLIRILPEGIAFQVIMRQFAPGRITCVLLQHAAAAALLLSASLQGGSFERPADQK